MNPEQRIADLEKELHKMVVNYNNLWATVEIAFGVTPGFFPNAQAVIEHGCRLRKTEPPRGAIMVPGWRPRQKT